MKKWEKEMVEGVIRNAYLNAELEARCLRDGISPLPPNGLINTVRGALGIRITSDFRVVGPHAEQYRKELGLKESSP